MALTPARQRNAVSEGMALGLIMLDCNEVPFDSKMRVDLAFEHAWREWPHQSQFSQVNTDLEKGLDAVWAMTRAERTNQTRSFYWEVEGNQLLIYGRRNDWNSDNPNDLKSAVDGIPGNVPLEGWTDLAGAFLADLRN